MIKILIFGTGKCFRENLETLDFSKVEIIGLVDNDKNKQKSIIQGFKVYSPEDITKLSYDYILIASQYSYEIFNQLMQIGVEFNKIIPILHNGYSQFLNDSYRNIIDSIINKGIRVKPRIALCKENNSGSNTLALYKCMPEYIKGKYEVVLLDGNQLEKDLDFDLVCSTHLSRTNNSRTINVELWHGFPLKKIGTMTNQFDMIKYENFKENIDIIISYSELYTNLFNSAFPNYYDKYKICGMPRNDLLFKENEYMINKILNCDTKEKKIIMYLPTYRMNKGCEYSIVEGNRNWDNIFGFGEFKIRDFAKFLRENNYFCVCKLHPIESNTIDKKLIEEFSDVIKLIEEDTLTKRNIDLYELLANIDLLITDYSSVYFDLLIKDIPLIFTPTDIEYYEEERGFNLEPYDFWAPGHKVSNIEELITSINESFSVDKYKEDRIRVRDIIHYYIDNKSSERVWNVIDDILQKRKKGE